MRFLFIKISVLAPEMEDTTLLSNANLWRARGVGMEVEESISHACVFLQI